WVPNTNPKVHTNRAHSMHSFFLNGAASNGLLHHFLRQKLLPTPLNPAWNFLCAPVIPRTPEKSGRPGGDPTRVPAPPWKLLRLALCSGKPSFTVIVQGMVLSGSASPIFRVTLRP